MTTKLGTPMYMAPEIHDKSVKYQGQDADLFALGVSLFVARTIDYPWKKPDLSSDRAYAKFAADNGIHADSFWKKYAGNNLSEDFKNLIENMLAHNPSTRPTMCDILGHQWMRGDVAS